MITTRRIEQATSLAFIAIGLFLVYQGRILRLAGQYGPGPGFIAFWVGLLLTAASAFWFYRLIRRPPEAGAAPFVTDKAVLARIAFVALALILFTALLRKVGYDLTMLALLLALLFGLGRDRPLMKIAVALIGSFGLHYLFESVLKVPLPSAEIAALQALGL